MVTSYIAEEGKSRDYVISEISFPLETPIGLRNFPLEPAEVLVL